MLNPTDQLSALIRGVANDIADKQAISAMLEQISTGLADVVALLEAGQKPDAGASEAEEQARARMKAQAMAEALAPMLAALKLPEPQVQVTVQPAAMPEPKVNVTVQPAPVTIARDKAGQAWDIEIKRPPNNPSGPMVGFRITRL